MFGLILFNRNRMVKMKIPDKCQVCKWHSISDHLALEHKYSTVNVRYPDDSGYQIVHFGLNRTFIIQTTKLDHFIINKIFFMTLFFFKRF
jgi:hypothetical protein